MKRGTTKFDELIRRLQRAGFDRRHVRAAVPSWWGPGAEDEPGAMLELKATLSRRLGLELSSLLNDEAEPRSAALGITKYKLRRKEDEDLLKPIAGSLSAIARAVCEATTRIVETQTLGDPTSARGEILQSGAHWVSFKALVLWCWKKGVPVIPAVDLPGKRSMDAATDFSGTRPVVLLTKNFQVSAWQLFFLSHELGHIACGHVTRDEPLIAENLDEDWGVLGLRDSEERAADKWAKTVLGGADEMRFETSGQMTPNGLARAAQEQARLHQTDAGHLILRLAFETKNWPLANAALKVLEPEPKALDFARDVAREFLDLDEVGDDAREFLQETVGF
jgi:hypothetical protein